MEEIIKILRERHWYVGVMESCTGGAMSNLITNIPGVSDVFKQGLVTYSDEAKIRAGVNKKIIEKYGVYSKETAKDMARRADGEVGVGITGNLPGEVFVAVRVENKIISEKMKLKNEFEDKVRSRIKMKEEIGKRVVEMLISNLVG